MMDAGCVAAFYQELERTGAAHELYRFNTLTMDDAGAPIAENPPHPPEESGADYLLARLAGRRVATMQELIFSRAAWAAGGIPDFPLAWHADEAFAAGLGVRCPLRLIAGPRVRWRLSALNISNSTASRLAGRKIIATTVFYRWLENYFRTHAPAQKAEAARLAEKWLMTYAQPGCKPLGLRTCLVFDAFAAETWGRPRGWGFCYMMQINFKLLLHELKGPLRFVKNKFQARRKTA
jgi:hypothetical protein